MLGEVSANPVRGVPWEAGAMARWARMCDGMCCGVGDVCGWEQNYGMGSLQGVMVVVGGLLS